MGGAHQPRQVVDVVEEVVERGLPAVDEELGQHVQADHAAAARDGQGQLVREVAPMIA